MKFRFARLYRCIIAVPFGFLGLVVSLSAGAPKLPLGVRAVVLLVGAVILLIALEAARGPYAELNDRGVHLHGFFNTRDYQWEDVRRFEAYDGMVGVFVKRTLLIEDTAGDRNVYRDINVRKRTDVTGQAQTRVDDLVAVLEEKRKAHCSEAPGQAAPDA